MSNEDKLETAGAIWDRLSTGRKWGFSIAIITVLLAVFGGGYWLANAISQNRIAGLEAQHERKIMELERQLLKNKPVEYRLDFVPPDEGLPAFARAKVNDMAMSAFVQLKSDFEQQTQSKTAIQKPNFFDTYVGQRFTWTGYITDVTKSVFERGPYFCIAIRSVPKGTWNESANCYFVGELHEEIMKALQRDQEVTITGVMNSRGELTGCKFVKVPGT